MFPNARWKVDCRGKKEGPKPRENRVGHGVGRREAARTSPKALIHLEIGLPRDVDTEEREISRG